MKFSAFAALLAIGTADAYSVSRSDLRKLGQKTVSAAPSRRNVGTAMKMEGELCLALLGSSCDLCVQLATM
jgi:hypothetical protein